ncbi:hypothetical protein HPG69_005661 [Diceros bicornis minor]|uniref:RING-type domain-containing protein n=1 Tax=Diceros bicornis minor TaxID=77932 RepID=A0A7J7ESD1_DICBM|nr:hypothetical protein HPG69_005661 [Diceros bicornis minor]
MDLAALVDAVMEEVACPICMTFLREPMRIDCGHSFSLDPERSQENPQDCGYMCSLCRAPVQPRNLWPRLHPGMRLKEDVSELHREQLKMFSKEDGLIMSIAPEHEAHSFMPMEDVTWEYEALEHLMKEQEEAWKLEVGERKQTASWKAGCHLGKGACVVPVFVTDNGSHIFTFPCYPFPGRPMPYFGPCYSIGANKTAPLTICCLDGED